MKQKPPCIVCGDNSRVQTKGGGSKGFYRYECNNPKCVDVKWQQSRPGLPLVIKVSNGVQKRKYTCTVCGQVKRNHVCGSISTKIDDENDSSDIQPPLALVQLVNPFAPLPSLAPLS